MRQAALTGIIIVTLVIMFLNHDEVAVGNEEGEDLFSTDVRLFPGQSLSLVQNKSFIEGYKGAKWGMSKQDVKEWFPAETFHWWRDEDLLWFSGTAAGESADIIFAFTDDKLYQVLERIRVGEIGSQAYVFKFYKFEELLIERYGEPIQRIRKGSPDPYVSDADAIFMGLGLYSDVWHTSESRITLSLQGADFELHLWIEYECIELAEQRAW
ncbi:MAG: hypothetical protein E3K32_05545 [wastewater metagenome]|nr:hypothetical protein [Candidatus Loosdrechtia aerotolerans]